MAIGKIDTGMKEIGDVIIMGMRNVLRKANRLVGQERDECLCHKKTTK